MIQPGDKVVFNEDHSQVRWFRKNRPEGMHFSPGQVLTVSVIRIGSIVTAEFEEFPGKHYLADLFKVL